jgi:hypothetical protein
LTLTDKAVAVSAVQVTDGVFTFGQLASIAGSHRVVGSLDKATSELVKPGLAGIQWKNADLGLTVQLDGYAGTAGAHDNDRVDELNRWIEEGRVWTWGTVDTTTGETEQELANNGGVLVEAWKEEQMASATAHAEVDFSGLEVTAYNATTETWTITDGTLSLDVTSATHIKEIADFFGIDIETVNGAYHTDGVVKGDFYTEATGSALALSVAFAQDFGVAAVNASLQYKMSGSVGASDKGDFATTDVAGLMAPADDDDLSTDWTDETVVTELDQGDFAGTHYAAMGVAEVKASTSYLAGVGVTAPIGEIATVKAAYETNGEDGFMAAGVDAMLMGATVGATYTQITGASAATIELMAGYAIEDLGNVSVKHVMNPVGGADVEVQADQSRVVLVV